MERYHALVTACRREADAQYEVPKGSVEVDLATMDVTIEPDRFAALPMTALAAARGLRHAVATRPGMQPPTVLLLGPYRCILSFDETAWRPYPYALHLGNAAPELGPFTAVSLLCAGSGPTTNPTAYNGPGKSLGALALTSSSRGDPMGRVPQPAGSKGSLRWIQKLVNEHASVLDGAIGLGPIDWRSPLVKDDFAEYRDEAFLDRLGITLPKVPLPKFWPARGPQWDAFGRAQSGEVILVEAKAHVAELMSSGSKAASVDSQAKIRKALNETASALKAAPGLNWATRFYQYTNRLAHAHLLQTRNRVPTRLVFVYFVGDPDLDGPTGKREWVAAIDILHEALGIRRRRPRYVVDVFIDIRTQTPTVV